jgi:hypothetical protein
MKVHPARIFESPVSANRVRYSALVEYDDGKPAEEYWFDFDSQYAGDLQVTGNSWLAALTPLAAQLGEGLQISDPVDPQLFEGVHENLRIWRVWFPNLDNPGINVSLLPRLAPPPFGRVASFFSGGVDSFFSVLFHDTRPDHLPKVDEVVTVWGLDIPIGKPEEIERAQASLDVAVRAMEKKWIQVWTNIRETRIKEVDWPTLCHGSVLAAVGLCLETRFWRFLIPGNWGPTMQELKPWGTHVLTEPNFSTQRMRFVYDGTSFNRVRKMEFLATSPIALDHLRLCWEGRSAGNCSRCVKCMRAMLCLKCFGVLERSRTFDPTQFSLDRIRNMKMAKKYELAMVEMLRDTLPANCDPKISKAVVDCIDSNSRYFKKIELFEMLERKPLVGWAFGMYKRAFIFEKNRAQ